MYTSTVGKYYYDIKIFFVLSRLSEALKNVDQIELDSCMQKDYRTQRQRANPLAGC